MSSLTVDLRSNRLFIILGTFFVANAIIAEFIGIKIFQLEGVLGIHKVSLNMFGQKDLSFQLTAGVLLWPFVFVMTDIINEYYGRKGVRMISIIAAALIGYAFVMVYSSIHLMPADWWLTSSTGKGVPDMNMAYKSIFGQGNWIIVGSLVAFLLGQFIDVVIFQWVKRFTGEKYIWLRSTGSTFISQFIDSFVVLFIAFYIGQGWSFKLVMAICTMNYIYKFIMAIVMTPLIYLVHGWIERYLGHELAASMKTSAMQANPTHI